MMWAIAILGVGAGMLAITCANAADLTVKIGNVRSNQGELLIGVYGSPDAFKQGLSDSATKSALLPEVGRVAGAAIRAREGPEGVTFHDLPAGHYAVVSFHDENDDGLLGQNALGVPTEGYGFSNNAMGFLSAPSFEAAAVAINDAHAAVTTTITLSYPRTLSSEAQREYDALIGATPPSKQR